MASRGFAAFIALLVWGGAGCTTTHQLARPAGLEEFRRLSDSHGPASSVMYDPISPQPSAQGAARSEPRSLHLRAITPAGVLVGQEGPDGAALTLRLDDVRGFEVTRRGDAAFLGGGVGMLAGAILGGVIGYERGDDPVCMGMTAFDCAGAFPVSKEAKGFVGALVGGLAGGIVGAAVGAFWGQKDRYVFVPR